MDLIKTQEIKDLEQLNLLSIFHYVLGAISALFSCVFVFHIYIGWSMIFHHGFWGSTAANHQPPSELGWFFLIMGIIAVLCAWIYSALLVYSGRCISKRKRRTLILIVAALSCTNMPLGLLLGVCTFVVLLRSSVAELFVQGASDLYAYNSKPAQAFPHLDEESIAASSQHVSYEDPTEAMWQDLEEKARLSANVAAANSIDIAQVIKLPGEPEAQPQNLSSTVKSQSLETSIAKPQSIEKNSDS